MTGVLYLSKAYAKSKEQEWGGLFVWLCARFYAAGNTVCPEPGQSCPVGWDSSLFTQGTSITHCYTLQLYAAQQQACKTAITVVWWQYRGTAVMAYNSRKTHSASNKEWNDFKQYFNFTVLIHQKNCFKCELHSAQMNLVMKLGLILPAFKKAMAL